MAYTFTKDIRERNILFCFKRVIWEWGGIFYFKMKSGALDHSVIEESLIVLKKLRCGTSQLMAPGGGWGVGKRLGYL